MGKMIGWASVKDYIVVIDRLSSDMRDEAKRLYPELKYWHVISTVWECEKSPFGICCYDEMEDRAHDFCIFCGEPEERK